jgi:hypothetical protein
MKGEISHAVFYVFIVLFMFLIVSTYPLSDITRRYAYFLCATMFIFTPVILLKV